MKHPNVRVRFAPSPTGDFHVGGARTALFNYLFARRHGGKFILRIEDTDQKRYHPEAMDWLMNGLRYLRMEWDEGPDIGGPFGPYIQSARREIYREHSQFLIDNGSAYPCFCTADRLEKLREMQKRDKIDLGYDRHCRDFSPSKATEMVAAGVPHTIRIKMPLTGSVAIRDEIRGQISFDYDKLQDAVLIKADGMPTYHFANVVDDHLMLISHILRGDEWVNSLPLHWYLYHSFQWEPPMWAHLPIILNPGGQGKMSKRPQRAPDGHELPVFVRQYESQGYLSEALENFMALLGWSYDDKTEFMSRRELIERFSLERISSSPAAWNYEKLDSMNGAYLRRLPEQELVNLLIPVFNANGYDVTPDKLGALVPLIRERIIRLTDAVDQLDFFLKKKLSDFDWHLLIPKKATAETVASLLNKARESLTEIEFSVPVIESTLRKLVTESGVKPKDIFQPLRVAVSGRLVSPPLFETLAVLGKFTTLTRIQDAVKRLEKLANETPENEPKDEKY